MSIVLWADGCTLLASCNLSQLEGAFLGLRSLILSGVFAQGQRLHEAKVAKQLGTLRMPIGQAIECLVAERLLERIPTGGCRGATITYQDIADPIGFRGVIEGTAARMAAEKGVAPQLLEQANATLDRVDLAINNKSRSTEFRSICPAQCAFRRPTCRVSGKPIDPA